MFNANNGLANSCTEINVIANSVFSFSLNISKCVTLKLTAYIKVISNMYERNDFIPMHVILQGSCDSLLIMSVNKENKGYCVYCDSNSKISKIRKIPCKKRRKERKKRPKGERKENE